MRKRANHLRRGVSLFEAIAALSIVGTISASALAAVGQGLSTAERARRMLEAEALSAQRVNELDLLTDQELQQLPDTVSSGRFNSPLDDYSWSTTSAAYTDQAGVYEVAVSILWRDGAYTVNTYVYRRPVITTGR